ncbi:MAG: recombinase family protein, partial [Rhodospirillaceae bacterium]|nr:recombinase family protein [Rhodospirillaceae bacterium]
MSTANPNPQSKPQTPQTPRRRAVAYLRMSTDLQQYSTENQKAAIEKYAAENEMEIVATYSDEARSGLRYENRPGMQQMLADAQSADAGFDTILVYDISRWGRFQDQDEGAALEFACRKARVQVHYC